MRRLSLVLALIVAPALHAQGNAGPGATGGDVASFLLAYTGELKLSDQQVTRLATIARRSADRRDVVQRSMDSLRARGPQRRDSAARGNFGPSPEVRAIAERLRDQRHADLRDALAVLTPDQQATAWELSAMRGGSRMARGPMPGWGGGRMAPGAPRSRFRGPGPGDGRGPGPARAGPGV